MQDTEHSQHPVCVDAADTTLLYLAVVVFDTKGGKRGFYSFCFSRNGDVRERRVASEAWLDHKCDGVSVMPQQLLVIIAPASSVPNITRPSVKKKTRRRWKLEPHADFGDVIDGGSVMDVDKDIRTACNHAPVPPKAGFKSPLRDRSTDRLTTN